MARGGKPKKSDSILRRLMQVSFFVAALTIGTFAVVMVSYQKFTIRKKLESNAELLAAALDQSISRNASQGEFTPVVDHCLRVIAQQPGLIYAVITRASDGYSLIHTRNGWRVSTLSGKWNPPAGEPPGSDANSSNPFSEEAALNYRHPAIVPGSNWGWIHVGLSMNDYFTNINGVYGLTAIVAGVTFIFGVFVSFVFARKLTLPIHELQNFTYRVTAGALDARSNVKSTDEIGDLAESINVMVEALETSQNRLRESLGQQAALREKEILLREIHHRVKNNMQILSSLMRLQVRRADNAEMRNVLRESEARIRSMGLLHEKLYQSESVSEIHLEGYLKTLTGEISRMHTRSTAPVEIRIAVSDIKLGLDTALPCGLIVTELVSNSLKYAFPDGRPGIILISVGKNEQGEYSLVVWDNGIGMPEGLDIPNAASLGLRLVTMLSNQLNGQLTISTQQGTRTEIRFKESSYKNRI